MKQRKRRNERYILSWMKGENRWRKIYRGKKYYFPLRPNETQATSYGRCRDEWLQKKAAIDANHYAVVDQQQAILNQATALLAKQHLDDKQHGTPTPDATPILNPVTRTVDWTSRDAPDPVLWLVWRDALEQIQENHVAGRDTYHGVDFNALYAHHSQPWNHAQPIAQPIQATTLQAALDKYISGLQAKSRTGGISVGRIDNLQRSINKAVKLLGGRYSLHKINEGTVTHIVDKLDKPELSAYTRRDDLNSIKQFIRWMVEERLIEQEPRNLRKLTATVYSSEIKPVDPLDYRKLVNTASDRTRLYYLLALNCGFVQIDISDLHPSEINRRDRTITRKRSKTRNHKNPPKVTHKLWPETSELLLSLGKFDSERVLTNRSGQPLVPRSDSNGKRDRTDAIKSAHFRIRKETGINVPFKSFRSTGASYITEHHSGELRDYYLGNVPASVGERHYGQNMDSRLHTATDELRERYIA